MKSEERHQLKENELQALLVKTKPFLEKNSNMILAVGLAIVVAAGVYLWMNRPPSEETEGAASAMLTANSQEDYADIATDSRYEGTPIANWARYKEGEMLLDNGTTALFSNREAAISDLKKALKSFDEVLEKTTDIELERLAAYGRACTLEALSEGDTSEAVAAFEAFLNEYNGSVYTKDVVKRIQRLQNPQVQQMYKWMAANAGKPPEEQTPLDGQISTPLEGLLPPEATTPSGDTPFGPLLNPPAEGEGETPSDPESTTPEESSSEGESAAEESSSTDEPASEESTPEESKPAPESTTEESSAEETAAEEAPSEESASEEPASEEQPTESE